MPTSTPRIPNFTTDTGSVYKAKIDDNANVTDRIAWAFAPHEQATPDLTVRIDAGSIPVASALPLEVAAQSTATLTAPTTNPRKDIVHINQDTGVVGVTTGTEAASPDDPAIPAGVIAIARINLVVSQSTIVNADIDDLRNFGQLGLGNVALLDAPNVFTANQTTISTDPGSGAGPQLTFVRDSASPAASDVIGKVTFRGNNSDDAGLTYSTILTIILDPTAGSEDSRLDLSTRVAGTFSTRVIVGAGLFTLGAIGGDQGVDTINASGIFKDGVAIGGGFESVQVFENSGTWTRPAGIDKILVEVIGGGAGGGSQGSNNGRSGGGAGGGYSKKFIDVTAIPSATVTVGAAGPGGVAGGNNGTSGGTSSLAALLSATGGQGGIGVDGPGGIAGVGIGGDINAPGQDGGDGNDNIDRSTGAGGDSGGPYGGEGGQSVTGTLAIPGKPGKLYGSGGSGCLRTAGDPVGGDGAKGIVIIWEFK